MVQQEPLTILERTARENYLASLHVQERKTKKPVILGMIGLVGAGNSSVARELAKHIGATIVNGENIRVALRAVGASFDRTRRIAEDVAFEVIEKGGNVVIDSDFVDAVKRTSLRAKARKAGVRVAFVSVYCDIDVMSQRIRENDSGEFFNDAPSLSTALDRGKDVKFREMIRRIQLHYRWVNKNGGRWTIRDPPCTVVADIDTTDPKSWKRKVEECAKKLLES